MNRILQGENLTLLRRLPPRSAELIYIDPPFNTGRHQLRKPLRSTLDPTGTRTGFGGRQYTIEHLKSSNQGYTDTFPDYLSFLRPRLKQAHRLLTPTGSLFFHIDPRESHYCKVLLDKIFGRECFQNEIIWAYDYGARPSRRWPAKHDVLLWYTRHPTDYTFNLAASDRIPYMAPKLVGPVKVARGKTPTDVWWHTIVSPTGKEKTGYPTQKPVNMLERIVRVHSNPGDRILDFFAGSGTMGEAAHRHHRTWTLIDQNPEAIAIMEHRLHLKAEHQASTQDSK